LEINVITGIGVDIVHIPRMNKWVGNPDLLERFFNAKELQYIQERGKNRVNSLAAHFAAKEAFGKALGTGLAGVTLKDIMILKSENGKPLLHVEGSARKVMERAGANNAHVSLSHDGDIAIAFVILEV
jgi:holo-[acyl-carrier protein] synthase